ncbi:MAG: PIN domain-containing protein [Desulfurococcales archaeon]|nr:PIN domain-containing protein [Desulfurococcales archaeon]
MAGAAGEGGPGEEALVVDTNVIISAMLRETGYTRRVLIALSELYPVYTPRFALQEIELHLEGLAARKGVPRERLRALLEIIVSAINVVEEEYYEHLLEEARSLVGDPGDLDFAALALQLRRLYSRVTLLTYNKDDYKEAELKEKGVIVATPAEAARRLLPHRR